MEKLKIEIRSSGEVHISGYVNAVERDSRVLPPQMAARATGPFVEKVSAGAFRRAISRNPNVRAMLNHKRELKADLKLREDNIGLHADMVTTDPEVAKAAVSGEFRGWSFGFNQAVDRWESYKEGVQRRTLDDFYLDEVSILTKTPAYFGTSVEVRSLDESEEAAHKEYRAMDDEIEEIVQPETRAEPSDSSDNSNTVALMRCRLDIMTLKGGINT